MNQSRRRFLQACRRRRALPGRAAIVWAQGAYPNRPVQDHRRPSRRQRHPTSSARLFAQLLSEKLGQQFIVEARPGAAGNIATEAFVHMPADGYTLMAGELAERDQRRALREAQLRFPERHRAGRQGRERSAGHGGQPLGAGQDRPRVHRLRQGQSRQAQHGVGRHRWPAAHRRRAVQVHGRRGHGAHPLQGLDAGGDRPDRGSGAGHVRRHGDGAAADQGRQAAGARGDDVASACRSCPTCRPSTAPSKATRRPAGSASARPRARRPRSSPRSTSRPTRRCRTPLSSSGSTDLGAIAAEPNTPAEFAKFIGENIEKWTKVIKFAGIKPI